MILSSFFWTDCIVLKDLISYEEGSIANLDLAHTDNMKFVLMPFDEGTGLTPHRAPGNAILTLSLIHISEPTRP